MAVEAAGRFEFEWSDVCDGWAVNQRFRIALLYEDGLSVSFGWRLSSWESKDGRRYRFFVRRFDGSGQAETVSGEAELDRSEERRVGNVCVRTGRSWLLALHIK